MGNEKVKKVARKQTQTQDSLLNFVSEEHVHVSSRVDESSHELTIVIRVLQYKILGHNSIPAETSKIEENQSTS